MSSFNPTEGLLLEEEIDENYDPTEEGHIKFF